MENKKPQETGGVTIAEAIRIGALVGTVRMPIQRPAARMSNEGPARIVSKEEQNRVRERFLMLVETAAENQRCSSEFFLAFQKAPEGEDKDRLEAKWRAAPDGPGPEDEFLDAIRDMCEVGLWNEVAFQAGGCHIAHGPTAGIKGHYITFGSCPNHGVRGLFHFPNDMMFTILRRMTSPAGAGRPPGKRRFALEMAVLACYYALDALFWGRGLENWNAWWLGADAPRDAVIDALQGAEEEHLSEALLEVAPMYMDLAVQEAIEHGVWSLPGSNLADEAREVACFLPEPAEQLYEIRLAYIEREREDFRQRYSAAQGAVYEKWARDNPAEAAKKHPILDVPVKLCPVPVTIEVRSRLQDMWLQVRVRATRQSAAREEIHERWGFSKPDDLSAEENDEYERLARRAGFGQAWGEGERLTEEELSVAMQDVEDSA